MTLLELQSSGPFSILNVSSFLKWKISFPDLHTSQDCFFPHTIWICLSHQPWIIQPKKVIFETTVIFKANY